MIGLGHSARSVAVAMLTAAMLTGCPIPIPPGYRMGSRANLGDGAPAFIVTGKTTRADVLLTMGIADGSALDEHWLSFGDHQSKGGVVFILGQGGGPGAERLESRRLVVYFDPQGLVERVQFDRRACMQMIPGDDRPCLDPQGRDLPLLRRAS